MPLIVGLALCTLFTTYLVAAPSKAFQRLDKNNDGKFERYENISEHAQESFNKSIRIRQSVSS